MFYDIYCTAYVLSIMIEVLYCICLMKCMYIYMNKETNIVDEKFNQMFQVEKCMKQVSMI